MSDIKIPFGMLFAKIWSIREKALFWMRVDLVISWMKPLLKIELRYSEHLASLWTLGKFKFEFVKR